MLASNRHVPTKKQINWVKAFVFMLCLVPLMRLFWLGFQDNLSANPIELIERSTGFWALFILLATLSLTPIRLVTGRAWQLQLRRMLGLFMFFYACIHLVIYVWLDFSFDWNAICKDIVKHPRILVGFAAFILALPLALTSTNSMMRRLRERWRQLHQLVYLLAVLAIVHFWWLVKKDIREPLFYALVLCVLLGLRIHYHFSKTTKPTGKPNGISKF
ncbi:MAG: sulfoxide reductase heme-binding subunit YedZ [Methylotenera sp.]|uniref:sulfite oxidase heme-binding subunit YedZ n=1 Tax=Methylotenera sp. TaxID=2051956 RepID=UPI001857DAB9|nr:protein-methionine-sulfoxide reductase heme-binding subunit MsrQ [Methylotenera sp.]NOU26134.1 sulfoxide reductase heme-binding subunit YedZ [Methylotenera sp.]